MNENNITAEVTPSSEINVTCENCEACCCRLEVMMITDTGVPDHFIEADMWGGMSMARLDDGWCAALNRKSMKCMIYQNRPLVCREYTMGGLDCIAERTANL
jgi:uncharacterized protein